MRPILGTSFSKNRHVYTHVFKFIWCTWNFPSISIYNYIYIQYIYICSYGFSEMSFRESSGSARPADDSAVDVGDAATGKGRSRPGSFRQDPLILKSAIRTTKLDLTRRLHDCFGGLAGLLSRMVLLGSMKPGNELVLCSLKERNYRFKKARVYGQMHLNARNANSIGDTMIRDKDLREDVTHTNGLPYDKLLIGLMSHCSGGLDTPSPLRGGLLRSSRGVGMSVPCLKARPMKKEWGGSRITTGRVILGRASLMRVWDKQVGFATADVTWAPTRTRSRSAVSSGAGDDQCVRVDTPSGPLCPPGCVLVEPYKSRYEGRLIEVRRSIVQGSIDRQKPIEMRKTSISSRVVSYNKLIVDSGEVCPQTLKRCSNLNTDTDSFVFDLDARVAWRCLLWLTWGDKPVLRCSAQELSLQRTAVQPL